MAVAASSHPFVPPTFLNVTAISAVNGASVIQCWQILPGFTTSSQSGTAGASILQLGAVANMSYSVIPPGFNAGLHNAPTQQYVTLPFIPLSSLVLIWSETGGLRSSRGWRTLRSPIRPPRLSLLAGRMDSSSRPTRRHRAHLVTQQITRAGLRPVYCKFPQVAASPITMCSIRVRVKIASSKDGVMMVASTPSIREQDNTIPFWS